MAAVLQRHSVKALFISALQSLNLLSCLISTFHSLRENYLLDLEGSRTDLF